MAANERYLTALSVVDRVVKTSEVLDRVSVPVMKDHQRSRGLRPVSPEDGVLLQAVMDARHLINGITNASLQRILYGESASDLSESRRRSSRVSRQLRMLRRHGLIRKLGTRRLYRVTPKGQQTMGLALAIRQSTNILARAA